MTVAPKLFSYADAAANALTGQVGSLVNILDQCLVICKQFTAISGGSFVDNSVEARLEGGATFKLFQGPTAANDEAYFGLCQPFEQVVLNLGTVGVGGGTLIWEFWNGSSWTTFSPADGTSNLTASGTVSWSIAALSGWATTAVNAVTAYWVRVRFSGAFSTNPLVNNVTITGWTIAFSGTNKRIYRMGAGSAGLLFRVQDDGNNYGTGSASTAGAAEAQWAGCETATDVDTTSNEFPTAAQISTRLVCRKSSTLDATARTWFLLTDDRTFTFVMNWGQALGTTPATRYSMIHFGEFYSVQPGDPWKVVALGRATPNSGAFAANDDGHALTANTTVGSYIPRAYTGAPGSVQIGRHADYFKGNTVFTSVGIVTFPNGPDGGVYVAELWITEPVQGVMRGKLRGQWGFCHAGSTIADLVTVTGAGSLAARTFKMFQQFGSGSGTLALETSNTWPVSS